MEALYRLVSGAMMALMGLFAPAAPMILCALLFITIDFLSGVAADYTEAKRTGRDWYFESGKAWQTIRKAGLVVVSLAMAWLIDACVLDFLHLRLARMFAGFICGVELWSFLENAAQLSDAPLFQWLRRFVHRRLKQEIGDE